MCSLQQDVSTRVHMSHVHSWATGCSAKDVCGNGFASQASAHALPSGLRCMPSSPGPDQRWGVTDRCAGRPSRRTVSAMARSSLACMDTAVSQAQVLTHSAAWLGDAPALRWPPGAARCLPQQPLRRMSGLGLRPARRCKCACLAASPTGQPPTRGCPTRGRTRTPAQLAGLPDATLSTTAKAFAGGAPLATGAAWEAANAGVA